MKTLEQIGISEFMFLAECVSVLNRKKMFNIEADIKLIHLVMDNIIEDIEATIKEELCKDKMNHFARVIERHFDRISLNENNK